MIADTLGISLLGRARYQRVEARAPWAARVREKDGAMFYVIARGAMRLEVEGHEDALLEPGDLVFLPRGSAHVMRDAQGHVVALAHGGEGRTEGHVRTIGGSGETTTVLIGAIDLVRRPTLLAGMKEVVLSRGDGDPWRTATTELMRTESLSLGRASTKVLQRLADVLFLHAMRSLVPPPNCARVPNLRALSDPAIDRALHVIHTRLDTRWTLPALARHAGVSRSTLAERFRALVGEPPLTYLARWRTTRAAKLLRETDDPISAIAQRVGYESVPSFTKAFKRWQGTSPGAHRRHYSRS